MNDITKDKLRKKILVGQSLQMICYEFKISEKNVRLFARENNLVIRTKDALNYAARLEKQYKGIKN